MKVALSATAEDDLRQIGDHIALDNPERAFSFMRELREKARELGQWPKRFPLINPARPERKANPRRLSDLVQG